MNQRWNGVYRKFKGATIFDQQFYELDILCQLFGGMVFGDIVYPIPNLTVSRLGMGRSNAYYVFLYSFKSISNIRKLYVFFNHFHAQILLAQVISLYDMISEVVKYFSVMKKHEACFMLHRNPVVSNVA